jgi:multidrug efflux pump subunit AcrA (membrane-fusion protein)
MAASACNTTAEQTDAAAGRGGGRGGRGSGQAIRVETSTLQHISLERRVDLSGTLVSPDQARVSSEVAGIIREVRIQLGSEVRAGDVLVRLEPRELALALERAESALRQVEAQLGIDRTQDKQPPADEQIASVRQTMANRDDARTAFERAQQLNGRGLLTRSDRDTA